MQIILILYFLCTLQIFCVIFGQEESLSRGSEALAKIHKYLNKASKKIDKTLEKEAIERKKQKPPEGMPDIYLLYLEKC